jgi:starch synthase
MHAQRYGALPIASRTGGFVDTVVDADSQLETGTGFLFEANDQAALAGAVGRALAAYAHPRFGALRRRVMRLDLGWERPARRYAQIYKQVSAG